MIIEEAVELISKDIKRDSKRLEIWKKHGTDGIRALAAISKEAAEKVFKIILARFDTAYLACLE